MLTQQQVIEAIQSGRESGCIDGRDYSRLCDFMPASAWESLGFTAKEGVAAFTPKEWTRENIIEQLRGDVAFGFEKALNQRGISSGLMYEVVKMWMWVLDDELKDFDDYPMYGLPLFKSVAVKYGFPNPIGDNNGDEDEYGS